VKKQNTRSQAVNIVKRIRSNLNNFVPKALRKRYGRSGGGADFLPRTRVLVTDPEGDELLARVVQDLGERVRVEFDDGSIGEVDRADLRRVPRRRRAPSAEVAPEEHAEREPADVA
jgi:hypothetical protein